MSDKFKYNLVLTSIFKKDLKSIKKRGYDISLLNNVIDILASGLTLPEKHKDHNLIGNYKGCRECHITPDWLLRVWISNRVNGNNTHKKTWRYWKWKTEHTV